MPLCRRSATGHQYEWVELAGVFRHFFGVVENQLCSLIRMIKPAVLEQSPLRIVIRTRCGIRPLDTASFIQHLIVFDPGDVAWLTFTDLRQNFQHRFGVRPLSKLLLHAPVVGYQLKNREIGKRLPGSP